MNVIEAISNLTSETINSLETIWNEVGIDETEQKRRYKTIIDHVDDLYAQMKKEAIESKNELIERLGVLGKDICMLQRDLKLDILVEGYDDEPLYVAKKKLEEKLTQYQEMYNKRLTEINELKKQQKILCISLGKIPREIVTSPLPSAEELNEFRLYLEELSNIKFQREEEFINTKSRILVIMNELETKPSLDFERKVVQCEDSVFKVTDENMIKLRNFHQSLETELEDTKSKITELRERVNSLWEKLEESPQVRSDFMAAHPGNSVNTLLALKEELRKLEEKKRANIKLFVDKLRNEINQWWDKCCISDEQKLEQFNHFYSDHYTEDLLSLHEMKVEELKQEYERNETIFTMYNKREKLWNKMLELEQRATDSNRYRNRGGQLLNEERERKQIAAQLPKIENELVELLRDYELINGKPFLIYGQPMEELFKTSWQEHQEAKKLKSIKKKLRDQNTDAATPMSQKKSQKFTASTMGTPSMCSTSKRKLFLTPMPEISKRSRLDSTSKSKSTTKKENISNKVKLHDRERRLKSIRKRSQAISSQIQTQSSKNLEYELFENELQTKEPACRSSLFPDRMTTRSQSIKVPENLPKGTKQFSAAPAGSTPRRVLGTVNTPQRVPIICTQPPTPQLSAKKSTRRPGTPTPSKIVSVPKSLPICF